MKCEKLIIEGMSCDHCAATLKEELLKLNVNIKEIQVGYAEVEYDEAIVSYTDIENAIKSAGFKLVSHHTQN